MNAYSGKRLQQNPGKVKQIKKREARLRKIGLSLLSFQQPFDWIGYFKTRKAAAEARAKGEDAK